MREAVIVSSVRTAVGKSGRGALATTRPDDLAAAAIEGALARLPQLDPNEIEDVILGCAMPEAEQGMNVARIAALRAGLPVASSAMTVNRFCASGLQSIAMAAERIRGGGAEVIVAGGTESMSMVPMGGNKVSANPWLIDHYADSYLSMGLTAERVAQHYGISREQADAFALSSHQKALAAIEAGRFAQEIVPVTVTTPPMGRARSSSRPNRSSPMKGRAQTLHSTLWLRLSRPSMPGEQSQQETRRKPQMGPQPRWSCLRSALPRSAWSPWLASSPSPPPAVCRKRWEWVRSMPFPRH